MEPNKIRNSSTKNETSNYKWIIGCLIAIIIGLVAFILFDRQSEESAIIGYLSFASLILSIILSVFAILFSYYSSGQIDSKLGEMDAAVQQIESQNAYMSGMNNNFIAALLSIQEKIGSIDAKQQYGGSDKNKMSDKISVTHSNASVNLSDALS